MNIPSVEKNYFCKAITQPVNQPGNPSAPRLKAIVSVTNDLTTDQRVDRSCRTLCKEGFDVLLVGRQLPGSKPLVSRPYRMQRMHLLFEKGAFFYAEYNFRLFLFLLFRKADLLFSNDTDTLPANYLTYRIKYVLRKQSAPPLLHLHDCHEYFRGMPELVGRKGVTKVWKRIEDLIFPRLKQIIAVNESVARLYQAEYQINIKIVRNVPFRKSAENAGSKRLPGIAAYQKILLYQGAVNIGRGIEEAVLAMKYLKTDAVLLIAGIGDISGTIASLVEENDLKEKVMLLGQVPFQELHAITMTADLGLSIEKDVSLNYHFALPNKFLDYIQARIPVLVSPFPEMSAIVNRYQIGEFIVSHQPEELARQLDELLLDQEKMARFRRNMEQAAADLCWENEEQILLGVIRESAIFIT